MTNNLDRMEYTVDSNLPLLFVDGFGISPRKDGLYLLRLSAEFPEGQQEQARLIVPTQGVKNLINVLCQASKYYPIDPSIKESSAKKKVTKENSK